MPSFCALCSRLNFWDLLFSHQTTYWEQKERQTSKGRWGDKGGRVWSSSSRRLSYSPSLKRLTCLLFIHLDYFCCRISYLSSIEISVLSYTMDLDGVCLLERQNITFEKLLRSHQSTAWREACSPNGHRNFKRCLRRTQFMFMSFTVMSKKLSSVMKCMTPSVWRVKFSPS